ncbi:acetyl-CoA carboxylase, carboxyltransferase subunit beta [Aetokthonos hydrillicola Thurmond2011]|jgi:acetyl-CoA carboxylase carboxyl transferase subunit beta|uniref:Acetyl-coenzyme A carboxylase carboxyl transferase subunit beta n=1 Tax=Aetokthonos hydrillicola Thurmond2011 TaxID=2712845 RepID=A0AAP5MC49_9CYAN|nr:acetyl-CoA carboxylase, carboxyltransferase subunit beta [Aetokthonos hydrillicola]MBO3457889.1 acetyl-CoA carboxylase carboxyltransferase subunit beta [Aetokthonos hydrillicola CCALA 1050]MBW4587376.1 acetyl-CoA carboxylase carboxyltransferase subunit beta [Aetokthonos hydrillicola CCALA 1050]MDR9899945.1 acetyl-CoA carboxylase, carboxyltransferase subunit beta [Aetokthonos hydrillicola Thurmond2011]
MPNNEESRGLKSLSANLLDWFANRRKSGSITQERQEREIADGLWHKCSQCGVLTYTKDLKANMMVCVECGHHNRVDSDERIRQLIDPNTWRPMDEHLRPSDPLQFRDRKPYIDRLREMQDKVGLLEAVQTGLGQINSLPIALAVMDFRFIGASMGSVVGEKLTRLIEQATQRRYPVVIVCTSGGARMQEGLLSLMQMAKVSAALQYHREARLLYIPVLTNPTMGGVTASFAMLGDIILAEPKATIGFAGRRVIEQTLREKLPEDFQSAEDLLKHGFVDEIVPRTQLKQTLAQLIALHQPPAPAKNHNMVIWETRTLSSSIAD